MKKLQVLESKWGKMRADLGRKLLEEQDTVFRRYYETTGPSGAMGTEDQVRRVQEDENNVYIVIGRE